jgi:NAD(P) transhydrogenase subunit alpha
MNVRLRPVIAAVIVLAALVTPAAYLANCAAEPTEVPSIGPIEKGALEIGAVEKDALEIGAPKIDAPKIGAPKKGAPEMGTVEIDTIEKPAFSRPTRGQTLMASLTIFVLAIFVGFEVITKVPPTLHTPLMSGSNAISGVTLIGAVLTAGGNAPGWALFLGFLAMIFATINVVGGFLVTDRMLGMFKK